LPCAAGLDEVLRRPASGQQSDQRLPDQREPMSDQYSHDLSNPRIVLEGVVGVAKP
jgi:hypothetical protein